MFMFSFVNINMECASHEISSTSDKTNDIKVDRVVQSWMIDYYFATLCRLFRERSALEFRKALKIFEAIVDELESCSSRSDHPSQRTICCFLARVMDGENLDVRYDHVAQITPLMSALPIWDSLKEVSTSALHTKIQNLLLVQSVAVCVKKGNYKLAKDTLKWLEKETELPEKLQGKLATIVNKKDAYDQVLMNFSFNQLLEDIDTFLDAFNQQRPSIFLIEAASKVVQGCQKRSETSSSEQDKSEKPESSSPQSNGSKENKEEPDPPVQNVRPKRRLLSKQNLDPWKPETVKKEQTTLKRTSNYRVSRRSSIHSEQKSNISVSQTRRKWTTEEDKKLRSGVRKYGIGKWKQILEEFDFDDRTGVNLKDRWRVLVKLHMD